MEFVHCLKIQNGYFHRFFVEKTYFERDVNKIPYTAFFAKDEGHLCTVYNINGPRNPQQWYTIWEYDLIENRRRLPRVANKTFDLPNETKKLLNSISKIISAQCRVAVLIQFADAAKTQLVSISPDSIFLTAYRKYCSPHLVKWIESVTIDQDIFIADDVPETPKAAKSDADDSDDDSLELGLDDIIDHV